MMQPKKYLNITDNEFKIHLDEFLLIQTALQGDYLKNMEEAPVSVVTYENAVPQIEQVYANEPISLKEQGFLTDEKKETEEKKETDKKEETEEKKETEEGETVLYEEFLECIKDAGDVIGNPSESVWKRIFPKKTREIVFKTSTVCRYAVLMYIYQDAFKKPISILSIKEALWEGYKELFLQYREPILKSLEKQGKKEMVEKIRNVTIYFEWAIRSEDYGISELDIWIFARVFQLQICLFSKVGLKGLEPPVGGVLEWKMLNNRFKEKHYFIRVPPLSNKTDGFHLITPAYFLNELGDFERKVQDAVSGTDTKNRESVETLEEFLSR
jgi:hypothetical protein